MTAKPAKVTQSDQLCCEREREKALVRQGKQTVPHELHSKRSIALKQLFSQCTHLNCSQSQAVAVKIQLGAVALKLQAAVQNF